MNGHHVGSRREDWGEFLDSQDSAIREAYRPREFTGFGAMCANMIKDAVENIQSDEPIEIDGQAIPSLPWQDCLWLLTGAQDTAFPLVLGRNSDAMFDKLLRLIKPTKGYKRLMQIASGENDFSREIRAELERYGVTVEESV